MAHEPWSLWILLICAECIFFRYAEGIARRRPRGVKPHFLECSKWISQMYLLHGRRSHFFLIHQAFPLFMAETRCVYKMLDFMGCAWFGTRTLAHGPLLRTSSLKQTVYFGVQESGMVVTYNDQISHCPPFQRCYRNCRFSSFVSVHCEPHIQKVDEHRHSGCVPHLTTQTAVATAN